MFFNFIRFANKVFLPQYRLISTSNSKMEKIIAIGQMCATNDKLANRQQVQQIVESAVQKDACVNI